MGRRNRFRTRIEKSESPGSVTGSMTTEPAVHWGEPSASEKASAFSDTIASVTKALIEGSNEATSSASSTTDNSPIPTAQPREATKLAVASYLPGEPLLISPESLRKVKILANGRGTTVEHQIENIVTWMLAGRGNWHTRTVGEIVDFYCNNFVPE